MEDRPHQSVSSTEYAVVLWRIGQINLCLQQNLLWCYEGLAKSICVFNRICCGAMEDWPNQSVSSTESAVVLWRIGQINLCLQQNLLWCYGGLAKSICVFNRICCGAMEDWPHQSVSSTESAVMLWRIGQINMCLQQNLLWCYGRLAKSICAFNRICCGAMEDWPNQSVPSTESAVVLWRIGQINMCLQQNLLWCYGGLAKSMAYGGLAKSRIGQMSSTESAVVLWRIGQINMCLQQNLLWCYGGLAKSICVFNRICCGAMEDWPNQSVSSTESAVVLWRIGQINMCLQQNLLWCYGGLAKSICVFNRICCGAMEDWPNQSVSSTESAVVLWRIGQINMCLQQNLLWCYGGLAKSICVFNRICCGAMEDWPNQSVFNRICCGAMEDWPNQCVFNRICCGAMEDWPNQYVSSTESSVVLWRIGQINMCLQQNLLWCYGG